MGPQMEEKTGQVDATVKTIPEDFEMFSDAGSDVEQKAADSDTSRRLVDKSELLDTLQQWRSRRDYVPSDHTAAENVEEIERDRQALGFGVRQDTGKSLIRPWYSKLPEYKYRRILEPSRVHIVRRFRS